MTPEEADRWLPVLRDYATFLTGVGLVIGGFLSGHVALVAVGASLGGLGLIHYLLAIFLNK